MTQPEPTTAQLLRDAHHAFATGQRRWVQGNGDPNAEIDFPEGGDCIMTIYSGKALSRAVDSATRFLFKAVFPDKDPADDYQERLEADIIAWNDTPGRTLTDVLAALYKAAKLALA